MIRKTIVIEVDDISVEDELYSFDYEVITDGVSIKRDVFYGDHSRKDDKKTFEDLLRNGYAHQLVIENITLDYSI